FAFLFVLGCSENNAPSDASVDAHSGPDANPACLSTAGCQMACADDACCGSDPLCEEASRYLREIVHGARAYYAALYHGDGGVAHFPTSLGVTPALGTCCASPNLVCANTITYWNGNTGGWPDVQFGVSEQTFHFSYKFESSGTGQSATFTATAYGD